MDAGGCCEHWPTVSQEQQSLLEGVRNRPEDFFSFKSIFSHPTFTGFYRMENRGILVLKVCGLIDGGLMKY